MPMGFDSRPRARAFPETRVSVALGSGGTLVPPGGARGGSPGRGPGGARGGSPDANPDHSRAA